MHYFSQLANRQLVTGNWQLSTSSKCKLELWLTIDHDHVFTTPHQPYGCFSLCNLRSPVKRVSFKGPSPKNGAAFYPLYHSLSGACQGDCQALVRQFAGSCQSVPSRLSIFHLSYIMYVCFISSSGSTQCIRPGPLYQTWQTNLTYASFVTVRPSNSFKCMHSPSWHKDCQS